MFRSLIGSYGLALGLGAATMLVAPTPRDLMHVLDAQIQRAKPRDVFKRTIVFGDVSAGAADGNVFPFTVSATIHDYSPGWPPNSYYGRTCVTRITRSRFNMLRDRSRAWTVEAQAKTPEPVCKDNASEGVSAFPLDSIRGTRVGTSVPLPERMTKTQAKVILKLGEYACTWPGGRMASKMKFRLNRDKTYADLDGANGGTYTYEPFSTVLKFRGGFLDGMGGKSVDGSTFAISPTLTCGPWE